MNEAADHTDLKVVLEALRDDPDALIGLILTQRERIDVLQAQLEAMQAEITRL